MYSWESWLIVGWDFGFFIGIYFFYIKGIFWDSVVRYFVCFEVNLFGIGEVWVIVLIRDGII